MLVQLQPKKFRSKITVMFGMEDGVSSLKKTVPCDLNILSPNLKEKLELEMVLVVWKKLWIYCKDFFPMKLRGETLSTQKAGRNFLLGVNLVSCR